MEAVDADSGVAVLDGVMTLLPPNNDAMGLDVAAIGGVFGAG
jgi:hypothetical protein